MRTRLPRDEAAGPAPVSTGHLPPAERVGTLVAEAYERYRSVDEGRVADYIPALAKVPRGLFGVCVVGVDVPFTPPGTRTTHSRSAICKRVLAVLATAGLYEPSGDWLYEVGLPGKSGVGGGIVTVSPGKGGLGTSAPLDAAGNSVRGQLVSRFLSE